jgi:hypothetical protein
LSSGVEKAGIAGRQRVQAGHELSQDVAQRLLVVQHPGEALVKRPDRPGAGSELRDEARHGGRCRLRQDRVDAVLDLVLDGRQIQSGEVSPAYCSKNEVTAFGVLKFGA